MNLKKIIIFLVVALIVVFITILIIISLLKKQEVTYNQDLNEIYNAPDPPTEIYVEEKLKKLDNENEFFNLENIVKNFYLYTKASNAKITYNVLDIDYIEAGNLNENNVLDIIRRVIDVKSKFTMKQIYVRDHESKPIYYCYGEENLNNNLREVYFKINKDLSRSAYSISIITKKDYEDLINERKIEENDKEINQNQYNKIKTQLYSEEEIVTRYFEDFIYYEDKNINKAYNLLNKEYREKRFKNISEYQEYINLNKEKLEQLDSKGMKVLEDFTNEEEYTKYINSLVTKGLSNYRINMGENPKVITCIDFFGYYYVFNIYSAMEYDVVLDQHTIDSETTTERYNESSNEDRVKINIKKIEDAINTDDYRYIYERLNTTFKNNNYQTLNDLYKFMNDNLYDMNKFEISALNEEKGVYTAVVKVTNAKRKNDATKKLNIVMKLENGNDFTMSFSM